jgi:hypothetical protein
VRSTLDEFTKELAELRSLVESILPVNMALAGHADFIVRRYLAVRRRFDYASFIVALYASLENFLENLVAEFATLAAQRKPYSALPNNLTQKHMAKSVELLARARLGEGRYIGVQAVDVVKNLYDCLTDTSPYSLNRMAVVAHDLNLRPSEINALFRAIGIEQICDLVRRVDAMVAWYNATHFLVEIPPDSVPSVTIEERINGVVERRNLVAHRGGNPDDLLGPDEMSDMLGFVEALSKSIFAVVAAKYLEERYVGSYLALLLRLREGPYKKGRVVVVNRPSQRLSVGQPVFVLMSPEARWGRIVSLQINDNPITSLDQDTDATDVGIGLDFKCPKDTTIYVLRVEDDVVWHTNLSTAPPDSQSDKTYESADRPGDVQ